MKLEIRIDELPATRHVHLEFFDTDEAYREALADAASKSFFSLTVTDTGYGIRTGYESCYFQVADAEARLRAQTETLEKLRALVLQRMTAEEGGEP